ncbi:MAG: FAD-binding protein, partial [Alphaproteobacteria bacterium]|nr:FAD-binding protein [Alphaproteobacteria bacterium]
ERLIVREKRVTGVMTGTGAISAGAVVLATGGLGGLYAATTNPLSSVGRGIALAARAGALLSDLEFVQFHPTALDIGEDPAPLASEALRGDGALLLNSRGERFMANYHPMGDLAPRDVVSRAIFSEMRRGQKVYLDCRALDTAHFPALVAACKRAQIDPQSGLVPVFPVAHYHMGGVATDLDGRTSVEGLWAAGEVAATGLHGANRLASNSLMEAVVMARRTAKDIARQKPRAAAMPEEPSPLPPRRPPAECLPLRRIMTEKFGVVRDGATMLQGLREIAETEIAAGGDAARADMALVARMIAVAALARTESRGAHFRADHPAPAKAQEKRSFMTLRDIDALTGKYLAPHRRKAGAA